MPEQTTILDRIQIPSPCTADWDEMIGNDEVRFCQHCSKHVNNLSQMSRKRALELVARSKGRICVRYYRRPDGGMKTAETDSRVYQIKRRASRLAAGAFTAVLGLCSSAAAQVNQSSQHSSATFVGVTDSRNGARPDSKDLFNGSIKGIVVDQVGALIAGVNVTLKHEGNGQVQTTTSDSEGQYCFQNLGAGTYTLMFVAQNFVKSETQGIELQAGAELNHDKTLDADSVPIIMGGGITVMPDDPLVKAASENDLKMVKSLIASGSDVNRRDEPTDATALEEAVKYGNREMVRALLDAGAEINARNNRRQTPLMMMDDDATRELVWDLVVAGAKVNLRDVDGDTALIMSAQWSKPEVLQALMDAGAKINAKNNEGETALTNAAEVGNLENVKLLVASGAEINAKNDEGKTALKLAIDNDQLEVAGLLRAHSAIE